NDASAALREILRWRSGRMALLKGDGPSSHQSFFLSASEGSLFVSSRTENCLREKSRLAALIDLARFHHGQGDGDGCADAFGAGDGDIAAVLEDDLAGTGEAEAGSGKAVEDV